MKPWFTQGLTWLKRKLFRTLPSDPSTSQEFKPKTHHDHALVLAVTASKKIPSWRQWRFVSRVFSKQEQRLFLASLLVAVVCMMTGIFSLLRPHIVAVPVAGGTITEGLIGTPKLINPLFAPLNDVDRDLSALIYSGLFRIDTDFDPQPDLAERFHWVDDKTLEVVLRQDARFHDGEILTSEDVLFTYQSLKRWHNPLAALYHNLTLSAVDDKTVRFKFDKPTPDALVNLTLGILPSHIWEDVTDVNATLAEANIKPIGSGPYSVVSFTRDTKGTVFSYTLRRFEGYYGVKPFIDNWKFRFYPNRDQAQEALRSNQIDTLAFLPWGEAAAIKNTNVRSINLELPQETVAFFNTKNGILKDERVRKALAMAIDKNELVQTVQHATVVDSPFPFLSVATSTSSDLEGGRILLASIGWALKEGENIRTLAATKNSSSTELAFTIDVPEQPDLLKIADLLKRRWSLLGVRVEVRVKDAESLLRDTVVNRDYQVLVWNVLLPTNQDLTPFWFSANATDNGLNLSNFEDRDVDRALEAVRATTTTEALMKARVHLSNTILARTPALFLLRPAYAYVISKQIKGVTDEHISRPADRLRAASSWYIKTSWRWK